MASSGAPGSTSTIMPPAPATPLGRASTPSSTAELDLLALLQVVGEVLADLAAHQLHLAVVAAAAPRTRAARAGCPLPTPRAHRQLAVGPVGGARDAGVAHHAAQVALVVGLGQDAQERAVAADLQHQPARGLGGQAQQQSRARQAAAERRGGNRPEVEPVPRLATPVISAAAQRRAPPPARPSSRRLACAGAGRPALAPSVTASAPEAGRGGQGRRGRPRAMALRWRAPCAGSPRTRALRRAAGRRGGHA